MFVQITSSKTFLEHQVQQGHLQIKIVQRFKIQDLNPKS